MGYEDEQDEERLREARVRNTYPLTFEEYIEHQIVKFKMIILIRRINKLFGLDE